VQESPIGYASLTARGVVPNRWDLIAFPLVIGLLLLASKGARETLAPLAALKEPVISLDPVNLPEYALRTTLRMLAAMVASLLFTFTYATLAAKSRRAEMVLIPVLDILQSVPVLGYISFTVVFFMSLFPGRVAGAEAAVIFAIFTAQAWNMAFSFYQSLRTAPRDLEEATRNFRFSAWQRFWRLEVPFALPGLIWNMMMSMSGSWFFIVASEAITVGNTTITLPGIGAYLARATDDKNLAAVGWVVLTMVVVIILYDQLLFRPLVAWADKFRFELTAHRLRRIPGCSICSSAAACCERWGCRERCCWAAWRDGASPCRSCERRIFGNRRRRQSMHFGSPWWRWRPYFRSGGSSLSSL
jgi:NitT/TauT family transport system permease protein